VHIQARLGTLRNPSAEREGFEPPVLMRDEKLAGGGPADVDPHDVSARRRMMRRVSVTGAKSVSVQCQRRSFGTWKSAELRGSRPTLVPITKRNCGR
jgi:hypothetical protein